MKKPKRTSNQRLGDTARIVFENTIPNEWMFVEIPTSKDYGLDGRVEIFDQEGYTTGAMFFVQFKGTDKVLNKDKGVSVQLEVQTCNYYYSLDLPVLIVCYHAPTKQIFVKWFHLYDSYYGRGGEQAISFRFFTDDIWNEQTAPKLTSDLEAFRKIRSHNLATPISLNLIHRNDKYNGISASRIELEIRNKIKSLSDLINVSIAQSDVDIHGEIIIHSDKVEIILLSGTGCTWHIEEKDYFDRDNLSQIPNDIISCIAIGLNRVGHNAVPAKLILESYLQSSLIADLEIAMIFGNCLCKAGRIAESLEIAKSLLVSYHTQLCDTADIFILSAKLYSKSFRDREHQSFQEVVQILISKSKQRGEPQKLAVISYNFGQYWASIDKYRLAIHYYKKASQLWSDYYCKQPYFYAELAYILFRSGRYLLSAKLYYQSLTLGAEKEVQAFYADALLFAGRYYEATVAFVRYLELNPNAESKWRLKTIVSGMICRMTDEGAQKRQKILANKLSGWNESLSLEENKAKLLKALEKDYLCQNAYFNLGLLEYNSGHLEEAFFPLLAASVFNEADYEACCNAILVGILTSKTDVVAHLVIVGCAIHTDDFINQMIQVIDAQPEGFPSEVVLEQLNKLIQQIPNKEEEFIIRDVEELYSFQEWKNRLVSDPNILGGETVFPDSRLSVRRVGTMLERGESPEVIKEDYPYLSDEDLKFAQRYVKAYPSMEQPTKG